MKTIVCCLLVMLSYTGISQIRLDTLFKNAGITGVQIKYTKNGKSFNYCYGIAREGETKKITTSSVFQAASLSKPVLAYITMKMVDKKILHLDTALYHYYKYDRIKKDSAAQRITARMVLHHLSGLPNWATNPGSKQWATSDLKTKISPGKQWSYSGEGFMLLQLVLEKLLQQSFETIAKNEVFIPLQMRSSSFLWKSSFENTGVYGHNNIGEVTGRNEFFLPAGAYSLLTTATDYSLFVQALISGKGLSKQSNQLLAGDIVSVAKNEADTIAAAKNIFWGLGFGIQQNEKNKTIWHWGDNGDFKCFFIANPVTKESLVYFTNSEKGLKVMQSVLNYFFGIQNWYASQWLDVAF